MSKCDRNTIIMSIVAMVISLAAMVVSLVCAIESADSLQEILKNDPQK